MVAAAATEVTTVDAAETGAEGAEGVAVVGVGEEVLEERMLARYGKGNMR